MRVSPRLRSALAAAALVAWAGLNPAAACAGDWPLWRGPKMDGCSDEKNLPTTWSETENVAWRTPLPGPGGATPVISGDRIFLTAADGDSLVLMALNTDGQSLWKRELDRGNKTARGDEGNSASPSPSTDGERVWAMVGTGAIGCFDFDGKEVWKFNLQDRYGRFNIQFGMTSTPILDGDRLYVQLMHTGGATVAALDKATGKEIWKHERKSDARDECLHSYASPVVYRDAKQAFLLTHGADYVVAHDLETGAELWRCGGMNPPSKYNPTLRFVASPLAVPGLIVVPTAKNGPVLGLKPNGKGDVTEASEFFAWRRPENTPDVPSPLVKDGLVYLCRENGVLIVMDAATGEEIYQKRTHGMNHRASPVYADGYVYLTARDGLVSVCRAGREFDMVAQNKIGEPVAASPAISNGRIYLRSFDALWAIENKVEKN